MTGVASGLWKFCFIKSKKLLLGTGLNLE